LAVLPSRHAAALKEADAVYPGLNAVNLGWIERLFRE